MSKWIFVFVPAPARPPLPVLLLLLLLLRCRSMSATPAPSAFLLNALLPGADAAADTAATSHISDFRQQPRSDSRADKPDSFPGFDAAGEVRSAATATAAALPSSSASSSTSASLFQQRQPQQQHRRPARTEFYAQLVAKIIGNIGVDNIIDSVERKHDKLQRLRRLKQLKAHIIASAVHGNHPVPAAFERPLVTEPLDDDAYADYDDDAAVDSGVVQVVATADMTKKSTATVRLMLSTTTPPPSPPSTTLHAFRVPAVFAIPAGYVSSLWTNYILPSQLRNTLWLADQSTGNSNQSGGPTMQQHPPKNAPDAAHKNSTLTPVAPTPVAPVGADATLNRLLLSPLRDIWHSATKNWYVNHPNPDTTLLRTARITDAEQRRRSHAPEQQQQLREQDASANDTGIIVRHPDGMRNRQSTASPSSIDDTSSSTNSSISTRLTRAKLAFLHAFYKYSKHMSNGNYTDSNKNIGSSSGGSSITAARRHGHEHGQQQYATAKTTAAASLVNAADANVSTATSDAAAANSAALPSASTTIVTADEFDANLNINDNVVAVGLAAERIAQLYGYRVPATAAVHNHRDRAQTTSTATATTAADTTNQHVVDRQQRLRRVGERFIAQGARGRRRSISSSVATPRAKDDEDDDDGDGEADEGDDDEHNASTGSTSSSGGGGMAAGEIAETVGIFVLEILGTIAGLGWGAFTYIQSLIYT